MAEQVENLANPPEPAPPAVEVPKPAVTLKRPRDDGDAAGETGGDVQGGAGGDVPPPKRQVLAMQDILYRIVLPSGQIGKVIGRQGARIQKVREETKATIKIADAIARHEERVIIISSKDSESMFSDAENALHQIACLILKVDDGKNEALKIGAGHVAANTIRLLIAGTQAGGLIGVSGQNIVNLRKSSGATITVLAENQLPLCASAHESDRVVQIAGDLPAVLKAVVEIGCQLRDNPPKQVISISPAYNLGYHRPPQQYVDPASAEYVTMEIMISESFVGGLIGRCGSNISRIRSESGATIKVHGGKGEQKHRQIHLGGSAQQVALAKQRVDEYIYAQMIQAGGQQSLDPEAGMMAAHAPMYMSNATNQAPMYMSNATNQAAMYISNTTNQAPTYYAPSFQPI